MGKDDIIRKSKDAELSDFHLGRSVIADTSGGQLVMTLPKCDELHLNRSIKFFNDSTNDLIVRTRDGDSFKHSGGRDNGVKVADTMTVTMASANEWRVSAIAVLKQDDKDLETTLRVPESEKSKSKSVTSSNKEKLDVKK